MAGRATLGDLEPRRARRKSMRITFSSTPAKLTAGPEPKETNRAPWLPAPTRDGGASGYAPPADCREEYDHRGIRAQGWLHAQHHLRRTEGPQIEARRGRQGGRSARSSDLKEHTFVTQKRLS